MGDEPTSHPPFRSAGLVAIPIKDTTNGKQPKAARRKLWVEKPESGTLHEHGADVLDRVLVGTLNAVVLGYVLLRAALRARPGLALDAVLAGVKNGWLGGGGGGGGGVGDRETISTPPR